MYGYPPPYYPPYGQQTSIKTVLIITAVVLAMIIGIYIYATNKAKGDIVKIEPAQYTEPGTFTDVESKQIRVLSSSLKDDLDGYNFDGHNYDLYDQLLNLNDKMFAGVCIDFQRVNGGVSFRTAFTGDSVSFKAWDHIFNGRYDKVIAKLNALNIV